MEDVSDIVKPKRQEEREKLIKAGAKAYDLIPYEDIPTNEEIEFYEMALKLSAEDTAKAVQCVAEKIYYKIGNGVVLVSLARGGITAGVLIKRYLEKKYNIKVPHYSLTLIGTMGIDKVALEYILSKHNANKIQFIDGWTGKGAVLRTLKKSLSEYDGVSSDLAVISDPANLVSLCGTHDDILIPSACLNSTLAGLISRAKPMENTFFGAVYFKELIEYDRTYDFIDSIERKFIFSCYNISDTMVGNSGLDEVNNIAKDYGIDNIHFIKPGVGETMRALIRKKPDIILIKPEKNKYVNFIKDISVEKGVEICNYPLVNYNVCSIYKDSNSDVL